MLHGTLQERAFLFSPKHNHNTDILEFFKMVFIISNNFVKRCSLAKYVICYSINKEQYIYLAEVLYALSVWTLMEIFLLTGYGCVNPRVSYESMPRQVKRFLQTLPRQVLKISVSNTRCTLKSPCFICKHECTKTHSTQTVGNCSVIQSGILCLCYKPDFWAAMVQDETAK